jgi:uncharacterized protein YprB with RNaseH-like and TPR domain
MIPLHHILFLDIETVPAYADFDGLPEDWKGLWEKKAEQLLRNRADDTADSIYERAGIYAEFGRIICISCGIFTGPVADRKLVIKSFYGDDEKELLQAFSEMLRKWEADGTRYLCAHNGKEFDYPYLSRRMIINEVPLPQILQTSGKKPWELTHLDTMELWKFGDFKSYTSLNLLAHALSIPTPKDDIDGSMVSEVYWKNKDLERIVVYCQKDVVTTARVYQRLHGEAAIADDRIEIKEG